jgi:hypothetical protein
MSKKWNDLVSNIWKETNTTPKSTKKSPKFGSGMTKKYHEGPVEYKYIENLNKLTQRLYFIYAEEQAGNNNFHNEKMAIINFFTEQLENAVDNPKSTEYIIRAISGLPKGLFKSGSGILKLCLTS